MNRYAWMSAFTALSIGSAQAALPDPGPNAVPVKPATPAADPEDHQRYRLYKTTNIWNLFLLDTRTGRLFQVQWSADSKKSAREILIINGDALADTSEDGRFSLTVTDNVWTGILLDSKTGFAWQCQWSTTSDGRGCLPIPPGR